VVAAARLWLRGCNNESHLSKAKEMKTNLRTMAIATTVIASALSLAGTAAAATSTSPGVTVVDNSLTVKAASTASAPIYTASGAEICQDNRSMACGGDGRDTP
jgi:hypothetical protein